MSMLNQIIIVVGAVVSILSVCLSLRYVKCNKNKQREQELKERMEKFPLMSKEPSFEDYTRIVNLIMDGYHISSDNEDDN